MKELPLDSQDKEMIIQAREIVKKSYISNKKIVSDVVCVLVTDSGQTFYEVDIEKLASGSGICAETSAVSNMILEGNGNDKIERVVALYDYIPKYNKDSYQILPPCGACRHNLSKFGNPWVIVSKTKKVRLAELYPLPYKG